MRLANVPWTVTRQDLARHLSRTLDTRVRFARVLYDRETGLSRGVGVVQLDNEQLTKDVIRRGTLTIEGRTVIVSRENSTRMNRQTQPERN